MTNLSYIPSFSALISCKPTTYKDKIISDCWRDNATFKYDKVLISYFYRAVNGSNQTRREIEYPKDYTLIGDSGGYQANTQGVDINVKDLCTWFDENIDIGFILDVPTRSQWGCGYSHDFFTKALDKTKSNIDEMMQYNMDTKLYGIVQGSTTQERELWLKMLSDYSFDGLGIGGLNRFDPMEIAKLALFDFDYKNIHILGAGGAQVAPVIAYMARDEKKFDNLTYDTASFSMMGGKFATYIAPLYPLPFSSCLHFGRKYNEKMKKVPCSCPLCSLIDDISVLSNNDTIQSRLIQLHNLHLYLQYAKLLDSYKDDEEIFMKFVSKHCHPRTKIAIEFLMLVEDVGPEIAYKRYYRYFSSPRSAANQNTIDNWI